MTFGLFAKWSSVSVLVAILFTGCGSLPIASMATSAMGLLSGSDKGGIEVVHIDNSKTTKITNNNYCRCRNCSK
jgi:hypothetical protein